MVEKYRILLTGGAGFIGQRLAKALLAEANVEKLVLVDVFEPTVPGNDKRGVAIKADLLERAEELVTSDINCVYCLHGIMSGQSETDFELGVRVNVDATRKLLEVVRHKIPGAKFVFTSSCAVYGGEPVKDTISDWTYLNPQTSYGTEKAMMELLVNDYSRRGWIDGRALRLPTITVRPGKPSSAASSFASGIIREPLAGLESVLFVARDLKVWICSPATVVKNLALAKDVPAAKFGMNRSANLPGITITVQEMINALAKHNPDAVKYIKDDKDEFQLKIVLGWPQVVDVSRPYALGFQKDVPFEETVLAFKKEMGYA